MSVKSSPLLDHYLSPARRLAAASHDALVLFCEALASLPMTALVLDRLDERLARARREAFGRRCWLLSWHRQPDGSWRARLSCPELERTLERSALTRSCAILRTARALARIREARARIGTRSRPVPTR